MAWGPPYYLMPATKWFPIYWPNETWEVISFPPAFDEFGNRLTPKPPDGTIGPWWKMLPKSEWPIQPPWGQKWYGAWPASKVTMSEDLRPSIWPGGHRAPPFGFIKIKMPGWPNVSGYQPKGNQIPFNHMRIQMRPDFGPIHHMKIRTRVDGFGVTKFYLIGPNWEEKEYEAQQYRKALKTMKQERFMQMFAEEIVRTKGQPQPSKDLFV